MLDYYRGKRVFVTGHTGFKGMWLSLLLTMAGAEVTGYALPPEKPELGAAAISDTPIFNALGLEAEMRSVLGDIRDFEKLQAAFQAAEPEIVFHLAAQPIVLRSYQEPRLTYETNVMGTVNLLECIRRGDSVQSAVNVTTDKVYKNREWLWGYRENEELNGFDPYSNSKSCSELVTDSYKNSFFRDSAVAISTARAGNVIGGGDFSPNRIIPDCLRAAFSGEDILIRNPYSVRPYQHVLEPLSAYLQLAQAQSENTALAGCYNVGPAESDAVTTGDLADMFCQSWGGDIRRYTPAAEGNHAPHEANYLRLDCTKIKQALGWQPRWHIQQAVEQTVAWGKAYCSGEDIRAVMEQQAQEYFSADKG